MTAHLPHPRTAATQLLLDQAEAWASRHTAAVALQQRAQQPGADPVTAGRAWRAAATGVVEGFTVLYLLAVLHQVDPVVADRAARWLAADAEESDPALLVRSWVWALVETGDLPLLPLTPLTPAQIAGLPGP